MTFHSVFPSVTTEKSVLSLPDQTFDFLEKPEYYFDGYHLNAKGRQRFTETLVAELVGRLRSANSDGGVRFNAAVTADRFASGRRVPDVSPSSAGLSGRRVDDAN
jgi:hypothetical protein